MALVDGFLRFVNSSPSPYHCVSTCVSMLEGKGYKRILESDCFDIKQGGKYFLTRNASTVFAFTVGSKWKPGNPVGIVAAHTDSPCLKVKPISKVSKSGYEQVGVECYGGGLWYTWFDRDLSVAGRVIVENDSKLESKLVKINRPILKIPSLAIHLNRAVNDDGFKPNKEIHTVPILAQEQFAKLGNKGSTDVLKSLVATELGVKEESVRDWELCLFDTQPACLGGAFNEFIFSARLDNQLMSYVALQALLEAGDLDDENIRMVSLFDHEECGSGSMQGAASNMLQNILSRLNGTLEATSVSMTKSFLISADMAHGVHPNYPALHEDNHKPHLNGGLVVKENSNMRYATNSLGAWLMRCLAKKCNVPIQDFCVRNDSMCGSTVGPILSSNCSIRTVDVGVPQFSMHSIREMCGVQDVVSSFELIKAFFVDFSELNSKLDVDH